MKAMILAAGRGERMRPLTDATPKPLLQAGGKALIEYAIENLVKNGFTDIVVNIAYRGAQICEFCGDGGRWGASIVYSDEGETALETAGGIANALPLLGGGPFLVVNSDVICDYPLAALRGKPAQHLAHLVMTANPPHHPAGDFSLTAAGLLSDRDGAKLTFSGIGVYQPGFFADVPAAVLKLRPLLNRAVRHGQISGEHYAGLWLDIGTPQRLAEVERLYS